MENISITGDRLLVISVKKTSCPDYRWKVEHDIPLPNLPYSLTMKRSDPTACSMKTTSTDEYGRVTTDKTVWSNFLTDNSTYFRSTNDLLDAKMASFLDHKSNKLLSKIKAQSLPIIMLYKERKETGRLLTMFADHLKFFMANWRHPTRVLKQLRWDYSSMSAKRLRTLKKRVMAADTLGNAWLQYRFAWRPLISDIASSLSAAADFEKKLHSFSQRVGDRFSFSVNNDVGNFGHDVGLIYHGQRDGWYGMTVNYVISDSTLSALGSLMDIPTTIWDAVPWSFVIDWAVDISTYLDLRNATMGTAFSSGCSSLFYKQTVSSPANYRTYYPSQLQYTLGVKPRRLYEVNGALAREDVSFTRSVLTSFPEPKLEYPLAASFTHLVDIFALVGQRFVKRL